MYAGRSLALQEVFLNYKLIKTISKQFSFRDHLLNVFIISKACLIKTNAPLLVWQVYYICLLILYGIYPNLNLKCSNKANNYFNTKNKCTKNEKTPNGNETKPRLDTYTASKELATSVTYCNVLIFTGKLVFTRLSCIHLQKMFTLKDETSAVSLL